MMKNAVLAAATLVALAAPDTAHAEFRGPKQNAVPRTAKAEAAATAAAMRAVMTVDTMLDKINKIYMGGLRRCYNKGLAADPLLQGKVTLSFSISPWGYVYGQAEGISDKVDSCIAYQVNRWRFDKRSDKREQNYRISLVLSQ